MDAWWIKDPAYARLGYLRKNFKQYDALKDIKDEELLMDIKEKIKDKMFDISYGRMDWEEKHRIVSCPMEYLIETILAEAKKQKP